MPDGLTTEGLRAWACIDTTALRHNVGVIRNLVGDRRIAAVVKANAYGHHLDIVVPAIAGLVDGFAVATLEEGIAIRELTSDVPVMVLSEFNHPGQLAVFRHHNLQPVVHHLDQARWLLEESPLPQGVWLKIDTGMRRLGVDPDEAANVWRMLQDAGQSVSLMSHLASAEDPESSQTGAQLAAFQTIRKRLGNPFSSIANSAGLVAFDAARLDHVRPGLLLYGVSPFDNRGTEPEPLTDSGLAPAMALQARLIAVKSVAPGDRIGYGATLTIRKPGRIGIVGFGYADGYPRSVRGTGSVWFRDQRVALAGRVSMDMLTIDLTSVSGGEPGDVVELWGRHISVAEVAGWADTIPYELLCRVAPRVPRIAVDGLRESIQTSGSED